MSKIVLKTPEGKRVVIDPSTDTKLYDSPQNPPNTGTAYTRGTDLYAHKARSGNMYFYTYEWSMWQGAEESYELVDHKTAEEFLIEKAGNTGWDSLTEDEAKTAEEHGFEIYQEDA